MPLVDMEEVIHLQLVVQQLILGMEEMQDPMALDQELVGLELWL